MASWTLVWREVTRFYRQKSRVIGVFGFPIVMWIVLGLGFDEMFEASGQNYRAYFFPGTILMVVLFTTIFTNISIIEDRHSGFLQSVLVAPVSKMSLVVGKTIGSAILGLLQGVLLVIPFWISQGAPNVFAVIQTIVVLSLTSFCLSALGFWFAWRLDSVQGFHGIMNLVLMPGWILSGALFPIPSQGLLRTIMLANPLTHALELLRSALTGDRWTATGFFVLLASTGLLIGACAYGIRRRRPA